MSECAICGVEHPVGQHYPAGDLRILITSFPKAGTNLIAQLFGSPQHIQVSHDITHMGLGVKSGNEKAAMNHLTVRQVAKLIDGFDGVAHGHIPFNYTFLEATKRKATIILLMIRDPRDVIVSHYHWVTTRPSGSMNYIFSDGLPLSLRKDPIADLIRLSPGRWSMYLPWIPHAVPIRFEELIESPLKACTEIFHFIGQNRMKQYGVDKPAAMVRRIKPTGSPTYRKGAKGDWQAHFNEYHRELYKKEMWEIHRELGYA